jgi:hypothetical protein
MPPAATTGTGATASTTWGTSASVPIRPVCPRLRALGDDDVRAALRHPPGILVLPTSAITRIPSSRQRSTYGAGLPSRWRAPNALIEDDPT